MSPLPGESAFESDSIPQRERSGHEAISGKRFDHHRKERAESLCREKACSEIVTGKEARRNPLPGTEPVDSRTGKRVQFRCREAAVFGSSFVSGAGSAGRMTVNVEPCPGSLFTSIVPP